MREQLLIGLLAVLIALALAATLLGPIEWMPHP